MGVKFIGDTYIVVEVPDPVAEQVMAIRQQYHDELLMPLPAEITLIGSSGVGVFDLSQDACEALEILDVIASETKPIRAEFGPVHRFPNTDIFVLTLINEEPFIDLHNRIKNSGLRFLPSPFPFKPHCTILRTAPVNEKTMRDLLQIKITNDFVIDTMSVYLFDKDLLKLLHRVKLTG